MKACAMCGQEKVLTEFHSNAAMADGLHFYCKSCHRSAASVRRGRARELLAAARDIPGFVRSVRCVMQQRGMGTSQLAASLGVKGDTVWAWLSGSKQPSPANQLAAAKVLDIKLNGVAFVQDEDGNYPDGMGVCEECGIEFASYRKRFRKHCSSACATKAQSTRQFGENNPAYKDGRKMTDQGYVQILLGAGHPMAARGGYALEHRYVMSQILGRPLKCTERVHHKNGIRNDNRPENLELWVPTAHRTEHPQGTRLVDRVLHDLDSLTPEERARVAAKLKEID